MAESNSMLDIAKQLKETHVAPKLDWYRKKKHYPMALYRVSGVIIISLGVAVPALAQSTWAYKDLTLVFVGFGIAAITSLASFFSWERTWRGRRQTESTLENLIAIWELEIARAIHIIDEKSRDSHILQATKELLVASHTVTLSEAEQFFDGLKPVAVGTKTDETSK